LEIGRVGHPSEHRSGDIALDESWILVGKKSTGTNHIDTNVAESEFRSGKAPKFNMPPLW